MFPADQHDEIDALMVERNAAQAEAKLWLRRTLDMQAERDAALKAYAVLRRDYDEANRIVDFIIERRAHAAQLAPAPEHSPDAREIPHRALADGGPAHVRTEPGERAPAQKAGHTG